MPNDEIGDLLTEIVKLQRKVSGLTHVAQHLFVLASSNQRFTEEQETAFKEIPKLLSSFDVVLGSAAWRDIALQKKYPCSYV